MPTSQSSDGRVNRRGSQERQDFNLRDFNLNQITKTNNNRRKMDPRELKRAKLCQLIKEVGGPHEIVYRMRQAEAVVIRESTVYRWCKGGLSERIPWGTVVRLARVLNCRPDDIADDGRGSVGTRGFEQGQPSR